MTSHTEKETKTDMRQRILEAAAILLADQGYKATTLRGIATAAGLKAASIYHHFPSKDDITIEILNDGVQRVSDAVEATIPFSATSPSIILEKAATAHLEALSTHSAYTRASIRCFSAVPPHIRSRTVESRRKFDRIWLQVLDKVLENGGLSQSADLKSLHLIILGTLNWTIEWQNPKEEERQALIETLVSSIIKPA